jgi:hypothetical protein
LGQEGRASGAAGHRPFDPGSLLDYDSDGRYRLSAAGHQRLDRIFKPLGYDTNKARFVPQYGLRSPGETDANLIRLDPDDWAEMADPKQTEHARVLAHEMTHSAQFEKLGYWSTRGRIGLERLTYPMSNYSPPDALYKIPLGSLNVGDPRFSLEQIAVRVSDSVKLPWLP